jgi:voltage-gated potassium channel
MARSRQRYEDLSPSRRRRVKAVLLARSALVAVGLVAAYYVLPMDAPGLSGTVVLLVGLLLLAGVLTWQIRAILNSPFPRVQGFQALIVGIPLLLGVFAAGYYVIGLSQVDAFTQPMDKVGAMYFTVTVFSTVGFGDITAKTDLARNVVTVQMILNLVVFGSVVKLLTTAVNVGLKRQSAKHPDPGPDPGQSAPATG